jgi:hypothetical protein
MTTKFSEDSVFTDEDPGEGSALNAIAGKLGLTWDGHFSAMARAVLYRTLSYLGMCFEP